MEFFNAIGAPGPHSGSEVGVEGQNIKEGFQEEEPSQLDNWRGFQGLRDQGQGGGYDTIPLLIVRWHWNEMYHTGSGGDKHQPHYRQACTTVEELDFTLLEKSAEDFNQGSYMVRLPL